MQKKTAPRRSFYFADYSLNQFLMPTTYSMRTATGTTYIKMGFIQGMILRPLPVFASSTNLSQPQPQRLLQQKIANETEPRGSRLLFTIKSQRSIQTVPGPKGSKPLNTLKPSAVVQEVRIMTIQQNWCIVRLE